MHWLALLCPKTASPDEAAFKASQRQALGWLALRFSPRVACLEEAIVLEVGASLRLFHGARALHRQLCTEAEAAGLAVGPIAWAATSLGALALARAEVPSTPRSLRQALAERLDPLPIETLSAALAHKPMLARLGCSTLADLRRLPRPALTRRFGPALLTALDQAYGDAPEAHDWLTLPERFSARLELPWRIEDALALSRFADQLLQQLCAWLTARHAGIRHLRLAWEHDAMRARGVGSGGHLDLSTTDTTRCFSHLSRLLAEHLACQTLAAPAGELTLNVDQVMPLSDANDSLLPGAAAQEGESLNQVLERIAVRLGRDKVLVGRICEDHRMDYAQAWEPWPGSPRTAPVRLPPGPQPTWVVNPPEPLQTSGQEQPLYDGPLDLVAGPHRIESGWWSGRMYQRDYYVARSATRGVLWIYRERLSTSGGWFLHGIFG